MATHALGDDLGCALLACAGPWEKADPASVGLSTQMLAEAAKEIKDKARNRKCFIAIKEVSVLHGARAWTGVHVLTCNSQFGHWCICLLAKGVAAIPHSNLVQNRLHAIPERSMVGNTAGRDRDGGRGCQSVTAKLNMQAKVRGTPPLSWPSCLWTHFCLPP